MLSATCAVIAHTSSADPRGWRPWAAPKARAWAAQQRRGTSIVTAAKSGVTMRVQSAFDQAFAVTWCQRQHSETLAAYPGGVVDRIVQLSNGEYEVHNIGVNWPHHVFVTQDFKVVGAN